MNEPMITIAAVTIILMDILGQTSTGSGETYEADNDGRKETI